MSDERIVTVPLVQSAILEQIHSAFECFTRLNEIFIEKDPNIEWRKYKKTFKRLRLQAQNYNDFEPNKLQEALNNVKFSYVPCSLFSYYTSSTQNDNLPQLSPKKPSNTYHSYDELSPIENIVYPSISSVQFSIIDEMSYMEALVESLLDSKEGDNAIGVYIVDHPNPLRICSVCLSTRDCEYLIDLVEVPNALIKLEEVFSSPKITKVFHNTAHCCNLLHQFGIDNIVNVFCVTTASFYLGISPLLKDLTNRFRDRLSEGWIKDFPKPKPMLNDFPTERCSETLTKIVAKSESRAQQDWRLRPFSLIQMRLARQRVHYLLYLYDSLRQKLLKSNDLSSKSEASGEPLNYEALKCVLIVSQHKASCIDWSNYRTFVFSPNKTILSSLYQQPLPNQSLYHTLLKTRIGLSNGIIPQFVITDANLLWISLVVPKQYNTLMNAIINSSPKNKSMYIQTPPNVSENVINAFLDKLKSINITDYVEVKEKKPRTLEETIAEVGWLPIDDSSVPSKSESEGYYIQTVLSPRGERNDKRVDPFTSLGGSLRHLRHPEQPTSVSRQIEGIPKTETYIFSLANNVRLMQKIHGKTKAKLTTSKEDQLPDEPPEEVLKNLVSIGYIEDSDAKQILSKLNTPKPTKVQSKKPRPKETKSSVPSKNPPQVKKPR